VLINITEFCRLNVAYKEKYLDLKTEIDCRIENFELCTLHPVPKLD